MSLFEIMAEEDPEYQQMRVLQDAGVIPVIQPMRNMNPHDSHRGGVAARPRVNSRLDDDRRLRELQKLELEEA